MNSIHLHTGDSFSSLLATLDRYPDAGIDPAFDADLEELERQFAERRMAFDHN
jgi:hypothetical protein